MYEREGNGVLTHPGRTVSNVNQSDPGPTPVQPWSYPGPTPVLEKTPLSAVEEEGSAPPLGGTEEKSRPLSVMAVKDGPGPKLEGTAGGKPRQGENYESSVSQEKKDSDDPISIKTDKSGRLLLESPADLQNLLLLRKTKREQKAAMRKPAAPPAVQMVPYYVDEEDFFKACDHNQLQVIERYLSTGGDVDACDTFKRSGLHRASSKGHTEVICKLIQAGANVHLRDKLWSTCLHSVCRGGNQCALKLLLNHGADITAKDKLDSTPLHVSVRTGHQDCVEHLIQCGAEINTQDREGDSPLHDAVRLNRCKIVQLLLEHGADTRITNQDGCCPMDGVLEWQNETKSLLSDQKRK
ncbi:ankyrin repeat domain-containing protein 1-like [Notolabrus celidotus]|uniref:ankyrin repeat domain-containing protein 1-like n=1 Tax=Notolabrus celidotus TaxID=1203425 RepID=UPI00148FCAD4|nr:ankyrin repeat domain-containing protein 1-like [Notolabrus celidotus]